MWPWTKRWRDWVMNNLWPFHRISAQPQALHYSFEKAGLVLQNQPIPWSAEAVLVEASVRLPAATGRRKADFQLRLPNQPPVAPEQFRKQDGEDRYRVTFRLPPPAETTTAEVLHRDRPLGQLALPVLTREEFLRELRLQMPTLFVRLGNESVACQTFVSSQCKGILASAVLVSPTSLVPLLDLDLQVELRSERGGAAYRTAACLCSSQLANRTALVTVAPRRYPRRIGTWVATWLLGDRPLASQRIRAISQASFQRSLRISDTRFVVRPSDGPMRLARQAPPLDSSVRLGPCFLVASGEPGMAGLCKLQVSAQVPGAVQPPLLLEQEALITDGPTLVAPGTLDAADLRQVSAFELRAQRRVLGNLPLSPAPAAQFTGEGGFRPAQEFAWSAAADEEMLERLNRLMENRGRGE